MAMPLYYPGPAGSSRPVQFLKLVPGVYCSAQSATPENYSNNTVASTPKRHHWDISEY